MSMTEHDPRDTGYTALYIAMKWHTVIPAESALRIARGSSTAKPPAKLTPELKAELQKIINTPGFSGFKTLEKKYRVSRYELITSEEAFTVGQVENHLRQLKSLASGCNGFCDKCPLDAVINEDDRTMCEFLQDIDLQNPQSTEKRHTHKSTQKYTEIEKGETEGKTYRVYKVIRNMMDRYTKKHPERKQQDIISEALFEYMEKHK
jgi:hypothetical protein